MTPSGNPNVEMCIFKEYISICISVISIQHPKTQ